MRSKTTRGRRADRSPRMQPNRPGPSPRPIQFRVPPSMATEKRVFLCCHYCGYSPPDVPVDGICPKCGGHSWERYALPVKLLQR